MANRPTKNTRRNAPDGTWGRSDSSVPEEASEPVRGERGIACRVLDVRVPEVRLDRPRVDPLIGQFVPAPMPEHVWMDLERVQACLISRAREHLAEALGRDGCPTLGHEDEGRVRVIPPKLAKCS
jgi:hypothetical protein